MNGAALSDGQNICGQLVGMIIPAAWDAAAITFQASESGQTYRDVYDSALGTAVERAIASANIPTSGGRYFALSLNDWLGINYLKVRSGTSGSPVNQTADRVVRLLFAG